MFMSKITQDVSALMVGNEMSIRVRIPHYVSSHILILLYTLLSAKAAQYAQMTVHETHSAQNPTLPYAISQLKHQPEVRNQGCFYIF